MSSIEEPGESSAPIVASSSDGRFEPFVVTKTGLAETLRGLVEPCVDARGVELVDLVLVRGKTRSKLRIFVDKKGEGGIGLDDLEAVNRALSDLLDVEDAHLGLFASAWDLEVSSPGVDRPLTKRSHFERAKGERIKVRTRVTQNGARQHTGTLVDVDDAGFVLEGDGGGDAQRVAWDVLESAHVIFNFGSSGKPSGGDGARRKGWKAKS